MSKAGYVASANGFCVAINSSTKRSSKKAKAVKGKKAKSKSRK